MKTSSNNKRRLLALIEILRRYSDSEHKLSLSELQVLLEAREIRISNRKTLYDDLKVLQESGFEIDYDNGYFLSESPFSLSEVKIISDSLNSLKSLDDKFVKRLQNKLFSFISEREEKFLKELSYENRHKDLHFINRLEDTLMAIRENRALKIRRKKKEDEEIFPLFLHRANDYYYLYYHYENSEKIYHLRFDNLLSASMSEKKDTLDIPKTKIIETIRQSSNSFYSSKAQDVRLFLIKDSEQLRSYLNDDFPGGIFTKDSYVVKVSVNDVFFSKLSAYQGQIKISDPEVAESYCRFLEEILTTYR